jgi:hypothetical protein
MIETVARSLQARLDVALDPGRIRAEVEAEFEICSGARVHDFLPLLVERRVRSRLLSLSVSREFAAHQRA